MWQWIKIRMQNFTLRAAIAVLPALVRVDMFVVSRYERFIADPLQVRGVSLAMQVRILYVIGAFAVLLDPPLSLWNLIGFIPWLANGFFGRFSFLDPPPGEEGTRNIVKVLLPMILIRSSLYVTACFLILTIFLSHPFFPAGIWLILTAIMVTTACDTKPPRPKRVKILIHATEGA